MENINASREKIIMSSLNQNIKEGVLALTADGSTIKFASLTNISQANPQEYQMLLDMQSGGFIEFSSNNQQPRTADFTLSNCDVSHFELMNILFEDRSKEFNLVFSLSDGSTISYENPRIKKQPMNDSINESESSFNIMFGINCTKIKYDFKK